jgi:predicted nucleotidyltransferase
MKKSLAHLPQYKREELKLIVKIILFGSYACGCRPMK